MKFIEYLLVKVERKIISKWVTVHIHNMITLTFHYCFLMMLPTQMGVRVAQVCIHLTAMCVSMIRVFYIIQHCIILPHIQTHIVGTGWIVH